MCDDDDGLAVSLHVAQNGEELVCLLRSQNGGGLVEDEDVRASVQGLDDLERLLLRYGHVVDLHLGVDVKAVFVADLGYSLCYLAVGSGCLFLHAQGDVLGRGQDVDQLEVLMYHTYAQLVRVLGTGDVHLGAVYKDLSRILTVYAREHIHQGGLAGAVLTQQGEYLSALDIHGHILVCDDLAAERLGDVTHAYCRRFVIQMYLPPICSIRN